MSALARAKLLAAVDAGLLTIKDVMRSAPVQDAAGSLHVSALLRAAGQHNPLAVMRRARHTHGGAFDPTLRWVTDPRSCGRRLAAYADALEQHPHTWRGFPFTPAPRGWRR